MSSSERTKIFSQEYLAALGVIGFYVCLSSGRQLSFDVSDLVSGRRKIDLGRILADKRGSPSWLALVEEDVECVPLTMMGACRCTRSMSITRLS